MPGLNRDFYSHLKMAEHDEFENTKIVPKDSGQQQQILYHFDTPSGSSYSDDDQKQSDRFYSNTERDHVSYICGSDVLIGSSKPVDGDAHSELEYDGTSLDSLKDVHNNNHFITLESTPLHEPVHLITAPSHEILATSLESGTTALDTSIPDCLGNISPGTPDTSENFPLAKLIQLSPTSLENQKAVRKGKGKRGRKPYFKNNSKPTCTICSSVFTNTASLKTHMLIHSGERPFQCDLCEKAFTRKTVLKIHRRLHTGEKPYACEECRIGFVTKEALARHMVKDHPENVNGGSPKEKPTHVCKICKKVLCSKYSLRSHMNIHGMQQNSEKKAGIECKFCKKRFTCRYTLHRHVFEKHNRRGIITCNICEESFASKWEHSKHQDKHASSKKFQCELCSKTFSKKFHLLYHLQVHEAEKDTGFTCFLCKKHFLTREIFLEHNRGYARVEMQIYSCTQCPISFSDPRQLKLHLNESHMLPLISGVNFCDICELSYPDANEYYTHLFDKHDCVDILCNECGLDFKSRRQYDEHFLEHE